MLDRELVLPHLVARRAAEEPDRPYLQNVDGTEMSFAAVHAAALRWAGALQRLRVVAGDRVAVMVPPCFDAVVTWLGIAWLGAIEVPVHTAYRGRQLQYTITNAQTELAIVDTSFLDRFVEVRSELPAGLRIVVIGDDAGEEAGVHLPAAMPADEALVGPPADGLPGPEPHDISSILYTSGTTGPSKGVMIPWAQAHATATGCIGLEVLEPDDGWYSPYPLHHASGKIPVYAMALTRGRCVIRERFSGPDFWTDVRDYRCTATMMIGATIGYITEQHRREGIADSPLRHVLVSPPPHDPEAFERRLGIRICSVFNMTEISAPISSQWRQMTDRTAGHVRPGYECRIVDAHDEELPDGTPGELIVRSDEPWKLMVGYWNMPEKTAAAWRNGWFHTGDICMRSGAGEYYFIDRAKDAIRRRGENISSMEVEVVVVEHPAVVECAAFGVPAEEGEEEVKVAIVVGDRDAFDPASLVAFLEPRMPAFMVPRYVEVLDALPRTATEKVQKAELRAAGVTAGTWDRRAPGSAPGPGGS